MDILYLGNDNNVIESFNKQDDITIYTFKNILNLLAFSTENKLSNLTILIDDDHFDLTTNSISELINQKKESSIILFLIGSKQKSQEELSHLLRLGLDDYFKKPFNPTHLVNRARLLLKQQKKIKEYQQSKKNSQHIDTQQYHVSAIKRLFDIAFSLFAICLFSPLFIIIAIAIRIESKGKVVYASKRVGTGYQIFSFFKFRSMYQNADQKIDQLTYLNQYESEEKNLPDNNSIQPNKQDNETVLIGDDSELSEDIYLEHKKHNENTAFVKLDNDPRITKVGRIIRRLSLDELPQFFNVLKGDMSIVGNRPLPLYEAELLTTDDWSERFLGPAGITGLWQIKARGKNRFMSPEERKNLDNQYSQIVKKNYSFLIDLWIIVMTIPAMFQKESI